MQQSYLIVSHADADIRARLAQGLREMARVDCVSRLDDALNLLALAPADGLVVELPATAAERGLLGRLIAAYPDTYVLATAGSISFDDARDVLRLGIHDLVPAPIDRDAVASAVREGLLRRRAAGSTGFRGTTIAVGSGRGGAGCTAIALHLAAALSRHGPSALVDADAPPFGGLAVAADVDTGSSVAALVRQHLPIEPNVLRRVGIAHAGGFTTLALWTAPGDADDVTDAVPATIDALAGGVPFVVVDVGRPVLPAQRALVRRAGVAIAVTTLDLPALRSLRALIDLLAADGVARVLPVLNRDGRPASYSADQAQAALGVPFAAVLPETPRLSRCIDEGTLLGAGAPDDPWWHAIERLAREIADRRREDFRGALTAAS